MIRGFLCLSALLTAGCGRSSVAPVSGTITLDGKPLAEVHVGFQPIAAKGQQEPGGGSYAITDASGGFTLRLVESDEPGAVVGKHRVEVTPRAVVPDNIDLPTRPKTKVAVPDRYNRASELTFDVPTGGTTAANFELKSK